MWAVVALTVVDPRPMLLILLGPNTGFGDGFNTFGTGSSWTGSSIPTTPSQGFDSGGGGESGPEEPGGGMPTCPPGELPAFRGNKWVCEKQGTTGGAQPPAPTGGTPPPAAPPTSGGSGAEKPWWEKTPEEAGIPAYGSADAYNVNLKGMSPEQRAYWSMTHIDALDYRSRQSAFEQWMAWQDSFDPSCPPRAPYQAEDGSGCVEKPDNSNSGYQEGGGGGGGGKGKGGGETPPEEAKKVEPKITDYDPRKFTYGNTWGEQNMQGGSAQPRVANVPGGAPAPGPKGTNTGPGTTPMCPPGQVPQWGYDGKFLGCGSEPIQSAQGPQVNQGRAMPGSTTSSGAGMVLTQFPNLNI